MRYLPAVAAAVLAVCLPGCSNSGDGATPTVTVTASIPTPVRVTVTTGGPWSAATASTTAASTAAPRAAPAPATTTARKAAPRTAPRSTRAAPRAAPTVRTTARPKTTSRTLGGLRVPNLVGDSLSAAFARLADLGVPRDRRSPHDVSGDGRTVLNPDNWQVCNQKPAAGSIATAQTVYQFGVVKFGERCP